MKAKFESDKNSTGGGHTWITLEPETKEEAIRLVHLERIHKKRGILFISDICRNGNSAACFIIESKKGEV